MKRRCMPIVLLVMMLVALYTGTADAARRTEMKNIFTTIEQVDAKPLTAVMVRSAIIDACVQYGWKVRTLSDSALEARIIVRNKHVVVIKIDYSEKSFSIHYVSSENMNYKINEENKILIHPNYNKWIKNIERQAIINISSLQSK